MKRILPFFLCLLFLCGCSSGQDALDAGHRLRSNILEAAGCSFVALITADYGDEIHSFTMQCDFDENGAMSFTVIEPESISGITGKIDAQEGALTFDDHILLFEMLADEQITPVSAPWLLMQTVRGGHIAACSTEKDGYFIQFDDSYKGSPLRLDLWIDQKEYISYGEFLWDGRRILSVNISDFQLL